MSFDDVSYKIHFLWSGRVFNHSVLYDENLQNYSGACVPGGEAGLKKSRLVALRTKSL